MHRVGAPIECSPESGGLRNLEPSFILEYIYIYIIFGVPIAGVHVGYTHEP